jgi:hypothetical protein
MGGVYEVTEDVVLNNVDTIQLFNNFGMLSQQIGAVVKKGNILTFDPSKKGTDFILDANFKEIKPSSETVAYVMDINSLIYHKNSQNFLGQATYNGINRGYTYFPRIYTKKAIRPSTNKVKISLDTV